MASTTNFGWTTPDDTALVKDGAAAIRTLGSAIDTSMMDLKGGTTGQVLTKATNTDMDFTWSSVDPLTILDAKGDLISATAADTPARLAVGTNGQFLSADSTASTGLKWVNAPTSTQSWSQIGSAVSLAGNSSVTISGISGADKLMITMGNVSSATTGGWVSLHINGDTTNNNYDHWGLCLQSRTTYSSGIFGQFTEGNSTPRTGINLAQFGAANRYVSGAVFINGGNSSGTKVFQGQAGITGLDTSKMGIFGGFYSGTSTISSIVIRYNDGANNFSDGYIYLWKSA